MGLYQEARKNSRRLTRMVVTLVPLVMLLVGSCKTADMPGAYGSNNGREQFRMALFPDRVNFKGVNYHPAQGYISRAREFVADAPDTMKLLTDEEVGYIMGAPAMQRRDAGVNAKVWQYRTDSCIVDVFFYDGNVSYVDMRAKQDGDVKAGSSLGDKNARGACLEEAADNATSIKI